MHLPQSTAMPANKSVRLAANHPTVKLITSEPQDQEIGKIYVVQKRRILKLQSCERVGRASEIMVIGSILPNPLVKYRARQEIATNQYITHRTARPIFQTTCNSQMLVRKGTTNGTASTNSEGNFCFVSRKI